MTRLADSAYPHRLPAFFLSLMLPRKGQPFPPERRNCSRTFQGVLQFRLPSAPQRYNTLDFPTENRVPTGVLLAPIGNPEPKGLCPSGHPACPCIGYPSCSCTLDTLLPEQVKQTQRFTRVTGIFLCLFLFSGGWTKHTRKPCRTLGLGWRFSYWSAKTNCPKPLYLYNKTVEFSDGGTPYGHLV